MLFNIFKFKAKKNSVNTQHRLSWKKMPFFIKYVNKKDRKLNRERERGEAKNEKM